MSTGRYILNLFIAFFLFGHVALLLAAAAKLLVNWRRGVLTRLLGFSFLMLFLFLGSIFVGVRRLREFFPEQKLPTEVQVAVLISLCLFALAIWPVTIYLLDIVRKLASPPRIEQ